MKKSVLKAPFCVGAIFFVINYFYVFLSAISTLVELSGVKAMVSLSTIMTSQLGTVFFAMVGMAFGVLLLIKRFSFVEGIICLVLSVGCVFTSKSFSGLIPGVAIYSLIFYVSLISYFIFLCMLGIHLILARKCKSCTPFKVISLISLIIYAVFDLINPIIEVLVGKAIGMVVILSLLFNVPFIIGLFLIHGWAFKKMPLYLKKKAELDAAAEEETVADVGFVNESAPRAKVAPAPAARPAAPNPAPAAATNAAANASLNDAVAQLKIYKQLLDDGVINAEEFEAKKKQILNL